MNPTLVWFGSRLRYGSRKRLMVPLTMNYPDGEMVDYADRRKIQITNTGKGRTGGVAPKQELLDQMSHRQVRVLSGVKAGKALWAKKDDLKLSSRPASPCRRNAMILTSSLARRGCAGAKTASTILRFFYPEMCSNVEATEQTAFSASRQARLSLARTRAGSPFRRVWGSSEWNLRHLNRDVHLALRQQSIHL